MPASLFTLSATSFTLASPDSEIQQLFHSLLCFYYKQCFYFVYTCLNTKSNKQKNEITFLLLEMRLNELKYIFCQWTVVNLAYNEWNMRKGDEDRSCIKVKHCLERAQWSHLMIHLLRSETIIQNEQRGSCTRRKINIWPLEWISLLFSDPKDIRRTKTTTPMRTLYTNIFIEFNMLHSYRHLSYLSSLFFSRTKSTKQKLLFIFFSNVNRLLKILVETEMMNVLLWEVEVLQNWKLKNTQYVKDVHEWKLGGKVNLQSQNTQRKPKNDWE